MARKPRIQHAGAIYHVMNRGDRREDIFHDDEDRQLFLKTLGEACEKTGWQVHAYCLMRNHFHLVVENSAGQPGARHEMVSQHLHGALQPPPSILRPPLQWPLQVTHR